LRFDLFNVEPGLTYNIGREGMGKELTEELKRQISELCQNSDMTNYEIAKALDVSSRSVRRHKDYGYQEESMAESNEYIDQSNVQEEDQDPDLEDEIEDDEQETETTPDNDDFSEKKSLEYVEVTKCPGCDTPKSEWATIDQALESGYKIPEGYEQFYGYVCPECKTLIPEKKLDIEGECPTCGSDPINWLPIEKAKVSEEIKRVSDFICLECWNPIKISD
jgi:hypothetical protein